MRCCASQTTGDVDDVRGSIDWYRGIGFLATDVARLMSADYDRLVKPIGLTTPQCRLLLQLHRQDGLTQSELANHLAVSKVAATGLIDRLEANGWLERRVNAADRRSNRVHLTQKAYLLDTEILGASAALYGHALEGFSAGEISTLEQLLVRVRSNLVGQPTDSDKPEDEHGEFRE